jgi:hypothetical protein
MCLNDTYMKVPVDEHLYDTFHIQSCPRKPCETEIEWDRSAFVLC